MPSSSCRACFVAGSMGSATALDGTGLGSNVALPTTADWTEASSAEGSAVGSAVGAETFAEGAVIQVGWQLPQDKGQLTSTMSLCCELWEKWHPPAAAASPQLVRVPREMALSPASLSLQEEESESALSDTAACAALA